MTYALKKIPLLLFFVAAVLSSCQQDDVHMHQQANDSPTRIISLEDLKSMPKAYKKLGEIMNQRVKKDIHFSDFNFTVLTDKIVHFRENGFESLTFAVIPDHDRGGYVENLVLNKERDGEYSAYFAVYNLTAQEIQAAIDNKFVNLTDKAAMFDLSDFSASSVMKSGGGGPYDPYERGGKWYRKEWRRVVVYSTITGQFEYASWELVEVAATPPAQQHTDNSYTYDDYNGGGSAPGGPTNPPNFDTPYPVYQGPVTGTYPPPMGGVQPPDKNRVITLVFPATALMKDNCNDLDSKTNNNAFQAKINELRGKAASQNFESGYVAYSDAQGNISLSPELTGANNAQGSGVAVPIDLTAGGQTTNVVSVIHNHLDNGSTYKIFTPADIYAFCRMANESSKTAPELSMFVITNSGTFALKIRDKDIFKSYLINFLINDKAMLEDYESLVKSDASIDKQIKGFLIFLKRIVPEQDINIDLYQQNVQTKEWSKLTVNDFMKVRSTPCPN